VDCNDVACRMNGYARAELVGQPIDVLDAAPVAAETRAAHLEELRQTGRLNLEVVNRHKDGRVFPVEVSTALLSVDGRELVLSIGRDITDRKQAEAALQESNDKLTRWLGEMEQRTREVALLNELSEMLQACVTQAEAYAVIAQLGRHFFPEEAGALCIQAPSGNLVERVSMWGKPEGLEVGPAVFAPEDCWALRRGRLHASEPDSPALRCRHAESDEALATLCVPMMAHDGSIGLLHLQRPAWGAADENRRRLAQTVADSVALALANLNLRETLRQQSVRDPLTTLFNRRYLEETLEREIKRAARAEAALAVIMLDIDHFKAFNDTFGHDAGDAVLREFGRYLRAQFRGADIACRYGGEEFVLILPEAGLEQAAERAEQLRQGAKHLQVPNRGQPLGAISISLGVAAFPEHGDTGEALLLAADAALLQAKREQRDRVVVAG
jgi:diguanylate cyclase (GGDEF)-like protein/PAS domain S-box-containing protein